MSEQHPRDQAPTDGLPLEVEAYVRLEREGDAYVCEILAGNPAYHHQIVYDDGHDVVVSSEYPSLARYTVLSPLGASNGRSARAAERQSLARLVLWIAAVLRSAIGAERAAVLSLPAESGAHWLICPLRGDAEGAPSALKVLGMEQAILTLNGRGIALLAGRVRQTLA